MSVMTILAVAENGNYFDNAAKACGVGTSEAKSSLERLCPAIAAISAWVKVGTASGT